MENNYVVKYYYTVPHGVEKDTVDCRDLEHARAVKQELINKSCDAKIDVYNSDGDWIEEVR